MTAFNGTPRNVLYRSRIEIAGVLDALRRHGSVLSADVGPEERLFLTRILGVDPGREFFVVAYSEEKSANAALLRQESVDFLASHPYARVEFTASHPVDTRYRGRAAAKLLFPGALSESQRRRHPRFPVPADSTLRCVADAAGFVPFEARITDISRGGLGGMIYDTGIEIAPGTILRRSRIVIPGHGSVEVDLEVRYTKPVTLPDGSAANRAGVRFLASDDKLEALLRVFVVDLDGPG